ncbi:hypothetical protein P5673_032093 [Acropora cervicornis]|uniref:Uncharacterized protein n=1 Tax=Acropora cervicornis TaxID=6130 RepID=A0AAD9PS25_ACRCE|nr:hypothetical protein P5673_032093 [Acropora cervicornis]
MVLQEYDIFSSASVGKKFWKIRPGNKAFLKALNITETLVKLGPKETHIIRKKVEKGNAEDAEWWLSIAHFALQSLRKAIAVRYKRELSFEAGKDSGTKIEQSKENIY